MMIATRCRSAIMTTTTVSSSPSLLSSSSPWSSTYSLTSGCACFSVCISIRTVVIAIYLLLVCGSAFTADSQEHCLSRLTKCTQTPGADSGRPVCGSDEVTYPSWCHLVRAQCQAGKSVKLKHRGKCRQSQSCFVDLEDARSKTDLADVPYVPSCRRDGTYAPVQCHKGTGMCWCVDAQGKPVPGATVRYTNNGKQRCGQHGKSATRRRSSPRTRRQKRGCKRADKALFNSNLINDFHKEWKRNFQDTGRTGAELDQLVLDWKFRDLDNNSDGTLDKNEYRNLRRLVKKFVKPKRCSKSFARACDMNRDQHISRQEWADCLTRDGMDDERPRVDSSDASANRYDEGGRGHHDDDDEDEEEDDGYDNDDADIGDFSHGARRSPPHGILQNSSGSFHSSAQTFSEDSNERRDEDATDCLSDRQAALNEQRTDSANIYVPECTPDGRYKKIQCYQSVGYCWCVHEDTGKNIPGTSVQHAMPKCDNMPTINRPMKGCPEPKKSQFLKELMEFLHMRMIRATNGTDIPNGAWQASREEKAATWNFVVLDKNKNKMLERKEWKDFRSLVFENKQLRRCGKRLPRYCDVNNDQRISMTEWLDCLNTKRFVQDTSNPKAASQLIRKGPNPLESILKGD